MGNKSSTQTLNDRLSNRQRLNNRKNSILKSTITSESSVSSVSIHDKENFLIRNLRDSKLRRPSDDFSILNPMLRSAEKQSSIHLIIDESNDSNKENISTNTIPIVYGNSTKCSPDLRRRNSFTATRLPEVHL